MTGGKDSERGTPQGGVVSPLLANLYMNRFLKHWRQTLCDERFAARVISYADDFVIVSRGHAAAALDRTRRVMTRLGPCLNEAKTTVRDADRERFDFLGYSLGPHRHRRTGRRCLGASPSKKSVLRLKAKVYDVLAPANVAPWPSVRQRLNTLLKGWSAYFSYGSVTEAHRAIDGYVCARVQQFLARRHKLRARGYSRFPWRIVFGELGVLRMRQYRHRCRCSATNPVGEPDAGNPHVRFDERGWETESQSRIMRPSTPRPSSTPLVQKSLHLCASAVDSGALRHSPGRKAPRKS